MTEARKDNLFWRETNFAWEAAKLWQVFYLWI